MFVVQLTVHHLLELFSVIADVATSFLHDVLLIRSKWPSTQILSGVFHRART